jgi:hypothetical protein
VEELELAGVSLGVSPRGAVQLGVLGEGAHVTAQQHGLERRPELLLPTGQHAQRELEVSVGVPDDRQTTGHVLRITSERRLRSR